MSTLPHHAAHHEAPVLAQEGPSSRLVYTTGLVLAVILTATSFWVANTSVLWPPGIPPGLAVLAIAQMGVHLVFFLHMTNGPDNTNHALALAFGVLILFLVVAGLLWIMADLHEVLMPAGGATLHGAGHVH
jgi:cytochrome o ubiquinol oxidase operon protein cyoD